MNSILKQYQEAIFLDQECEKRLTHGKIETLVKRGQAVRNIIADETFLNNDSDYTISIRWTGGNPRDFIFKTGDLVYMVDAELCEASNNEDVEKLSSPIPGIISMDENHKILLTKRGDLTESDLELLDSPNLVIVKRNTDAVARAMQEALIAAQQSDERSFMIAACQKGIRLSVDTATGWPQLDPLLNDPQKQAVSQALASELTVIHGPPGTGKTSVLIEILRQLQKAGSKVLVCSASNLAVDNIAIRLMRHIPESKMMRLGSSPKIDEKCLGFSSKNAIKNSPVLSAARARCSSLFNLARYSGRPGYWKKLKLFRKSMKGMVTEELARKTSKADLVFTTLHSSNLIAKYNKALPLEEHIEFDTLVIDEVSQALYPQCLVPFASTSGFSKIIVAGDNMQLPPVVKTKITWANALLSKTMFDWMVEKHGNTACCFLTIQYRMNSCIMSFPSEEFYGGKLIAAPSVQNRDLSGLSLTRAVATGNVVMIDTKGTSLEGARDPASKSLTNVAEAALVKRTVQGLLQIGVSKDHIGIISPYKQQVALLATLLPGIECSTIDGFQGREQEIIVLSLVRSNNDMKVGFLADTRRLNVAITRPKRHLLIIGDRTLLNNNSCYRKWFEHLESRGFIAEDMGNPYTAKVSLDLAAQFTNLKI